MNESGTFQRNAEIFAITILSMLLLSCTVSKNEKPQAPRVIGKAIELSANYLANQIKNDGMFVYSKNMDPDVKPNEEYNLLRHAGSVYALSAYDKIEPDSDLQSKLMLAGKYLQKEAIAPVAGGEEMLGVWSKPEVNGTKDSPRVKLGGNGLGLAALMSIERFEPGFTHIEDLRALGRFIVFMQKEDGSFYSRYIPKEGGRNDKWTSLFYPGEAALGLIMLYEKDRDQRWLETANKTLEHLALTRKDLSRVPADHWALIATEKILPFKEKELSPGSRNLLKNHAVQICEEILRQQIDKPDNPKLDGGFNENGSTTSAATGLEGLIAALSFLEPGSDIRKRVEKSVERGIGFLLQAQVKDGEFAGAIPRAVQKIPEKSEEDQEFNRTVNEVRIDYVQHALSAMIAYAELKESKLSTP